MEPLQQLIAYIERYEPLTEAQREQVASLVRITPVRRRQAIVQPGFPCRHRSYVAQGALRAYLTTNEGQDHSIAFAIDDWWISDYNSYIFQQPATLFVEALEDSTLVQLDYNAEQLLVTTDPTFARFFLRITKRSFAYLQRRMLDSLSLSAEQRYEAFLSRYGAIAARVPQYALASYLGMTTEYLSKLRNRKVPRH